MTAVGLRLALAALFIAPVSLPAAAQQRQPANLSTVPSATPQPFHLLDNTGSWIQVGTVDPLMHQFTSTPYAIQQQQNPPTYPIVGIVDGNRLVSGVWDIKDEFGNNTVPLFQSFVVSQDTPANATGGNANIAIAGYGRSASLNQGAVGVFGFGGVTGGGGSGSNAFAAWGMDQLVTNCPTTNCATKTGFDYGDIYGDEIDVNLRLPANGVTPNVNTKGLWIVGSSETQTTNQSNAIEIGPLGLYAAIPWKEAIRLDDGAGQVGLDLGLIAAGNGHGSMPVDFRGLDSTGASSLGSVGMDQSGDLVLTSGNVGADVLVQDIAATRMALFDDVNSIIYSGLTVNKAITATGVVNSKGVVSTGVITVANGVGSVGLQLGASGVGNGFGSSAVQFQSVNAGGTNFAGNMGQDDNGNIAIRTGAANSVLAIEDSTGAVSASFSPGVVTINSSNLIPNTPHTQVLGTIGNPWLAIVVDNIKVGGATVDIAGGPTFFSGVCGGSMGIANNTAAFTVNTGGGSCASTLTLTMPGAPDGWVCDGFDEAAAGASRMQQTIGTVTEVQFTNYSVGGTPAPAAFSPSRTIKIMCRAY
jgi:hypothetical protein